MSLAEYVDGGGRGHQAPRPRRVARLSEASGARSAPIPAGVGPWPVGRWWLARPAAMRTVVGSARHTARPGSLVAPPAAVNVFRESH